MARVVKIPPANAEDARDTGLISRTGRSPGIGNDNLFQYSCLENSMDRGAWWATVHGATKNRTWFSDWIQKIINDILLISSQFFCIFHFFYKEYIVLLGWGGKVLSCYFYFCFSMKNQGCVSGAGDQAPLQRLVWECVWRGTAAGSWYNQECWIANLGMGMTGQ